MPRTECKLRVVTFYLYCIQFQCLPCSNTRRGFLKIVFLWETVASKPPPVFAPFMWVFSCWWPLGAQICVEYLSIYVYIYMIVYIYIYLYYIASYRCFPANILALKKNIQTKYCILNFFHDCDCCGSIFHVTIWNWNSFGALSLFLHWHVSGAHGLVGASAPSLKIHVEGWIGCWLLQVRGTEGPKCLDWDAPLVGLWKVKVNKGILY